MAMAMRQACEDSVLAAERVPGYWTLREASQVLGSSYDALRMRLIRQRVPVRRAGRTILLDSKALFRLWLECQP